MSQPIRSETLEYERYVDSLRTANAGYGNRDTEDD